MKMFLNFVKGMAVCIILALAYCGLIFTTKPELAEDFGKRMKGF